MLIVKSKKVYSRVLSLFRNMPTEWQYNAHLDGALDIAKAYFDQGFKKTLLREAFDANDHAIPHLSTQLHHCPSPPARGWPKAG